MNVTFIGLGAMGSAMVERLLLAHYEVTVFNRTHAKAIPLIELGAHNAEIIAQAVSNADMVMTSLLDDDAVLAVTKELLSHMKPSAIHVGLSTIMPTTAELLLDIHQKAHLHYVSAVVLGVPAVARAGELTTFVAGNEHSVQKAIPLLSSFSSHVIPVGDEKEIKAPNLMKICMNYSLMTAIELMSELFVFAEKCGLDKEMVRKGLHQIYGHPAFKRYIDKIAKRDFDNVNFTMTGGQKDARIFQRVFSEAGIAPELCNLLNERYDTAMSLHMKEKDWSGIYEVVRKKSNLD